MGGRRGQGRPWAARCYPVWARGQGRPGGARQALAEKRPAADGAGALGARRSCGRGPAGRPAGHVAIGCAAACPWPPGPGAAHDEMRRVAIGCAAACPWPPCASPYARTPPRGANHMPPTAR